VIEFGEFVHALSVFHPKAPLAEKAECARIPTHPHTAHRQRLLRPLRSCSCVCERQRAVSDVLCLSAVAFRIYDLGHTGAIDRSEVRTMLVAMLKEDSSTMRLPDAALEQIIDTTFSVASKEVKLSSEDSIGPGEWLAFVNKMPQILNNMTLPVLRELTTVFPSFLLNSVASHQDMSSLAGDSDVRAAAAGVRAAEANRG